MNSRKVFLLAGSFLLYFLVQVLMLKNMVIFGVAFCFLYVLYVLLLPVEMKTIPLMLIAFILGLIVDFFYDTMGMHTLCLVAIAFFRNFWLDILTPTGGYDENLQPSMLNMGLGWFVTYSIPLILVHHILFFYVDSLGTNLFFPVVQKIIASTIFVFVMSIVVQLLFYRRRRGI
ncbi:rod shape-determining protein MreD [Cecembia calidifontis]|jgi:hypothetical protein|uniref:Rod shape-determining protein MreD n=1 Tax=Cecembia calidifontis TaxID=1187080 RepID=A0A4Q7P6W4_9BACT|nr:rod shape-determining protein MreD [Cecembia calidifontis]RZS95761.1 hypothetical protein BC751_1302 [Cecembia calidifontis]